MATVDDFRQALIEVIHSSEFQADVATLWDLRKLDFSSIDLEFAEQLVEMRKNAPQRGQARLAIIASDPHGFSMSRMYEMLSGDLPQQIMVFKDLAEGERWLQGD